MTNEEARYNLIYARRWHDMPKDEALDIAVNALSAIEDIKAEIRNMPKNFNIEEAEEWNSKSLYTIITRCSNQALKIIDNHISVKENK